MNRLLTFASILLTVVAVFAFLSGVSPALADTLGPKAGGTFADDATVGTRAWTNPGNAVASDSVYATSASATQSSITTHYLKATNFGFAIPAGSTINGITVVVVRKCTAINTTPCKDTTVSIVKSSGSFGTTNKADTTTVWPTTNTSATYGGAADLWGESWAASDINSSNFGVGISATIRSTSQNGADTGSIDFISITVTYTAGGGGGAVSVTSDAVLFE